MGYFGNTDSRTIAEYAKDFTRDKDYFKPYTMLYAHRVGNVLYSAVQVNDRVIAVVTVLRKEDGYIYTKDMEETVGPYYYGANKKLLNMLTPTNNQQAIEWRKKCYEKYENKQDGTFTITTLHNPSKRIVCYMSKTGRRMRKPSTITMNLLPVMIRKAKEWKTADYSYIFMGNDNVELNRI